MFFAYICYIGYRPTQHLHRPIGRSKPIGDIASWKFKQLNVSWFQLKQLGLQDISSKRYGFKSPETSTKRNGMENWVCEKCNSCRSIVRRIRYDHCMIPQRFIISKNWSRKTSHPGHVRWSSMTHQDRLMPKPFHFAAYVRFFILAQHQTWVFHPDVMASKLQRIPNQSRFACCLHRCCAMYIDRAVRGQGFKPNWPCFVDTKRWHLAKVFSQVGCCNML